MSHGAGATNNNWTPGKVGNESKLRYFMLIKKCKVRQIMSQKKFGLSDCTVSCIVTRNKNQIKVNSLRWHDDDDHISYNQ